MLATYRVAAMLSKRVRLETSHGHRKTPLIIFHPQTEQPHALCMTNVHGNWDRRGSLAQNVYVRYGEAS